jgi:hypothetical protein
MVVSRFDGCVRREHGRGARFADRLVRLEPVVLHAVPSELEHRERAVSFVQVNDARRDAERAKRAHPAHAEDELLLNAHSLVAAVEARAELAIGVAVCRVARVEQQEAYGTDPHLEHLRVHDAPR